MSGSSSHLQGIEKSLRWLTFPEVRQPLSPTLAVCGALFVPFTCDLGRLVLICELNQAARKRSKELQDASGSLYIEVEAARVLEA